MLCDQPARQQQAGPTQRPHSAPASSRDRAVLDQGQFCQRIDQQERSRGVAGRHRLLEVGQAGLPKLRPYAIARRIPDGVMAGRAVCDRISDSRILAVSGGKRALGRRSRIQIKLIMHDGSRLGPCEGPHIECLPFFPDSAAACPETAARKF
jgi:hypothetical protein